MVNKLVGLGAVVLCLLSSGTAAARAQSQLEMNLSAERELKATEAQMNDILARLFKMAEGKPISIGKLKAAQSTWLAFREAHVNAYWPSEDQQAMYGTVHPMCVMVEVTRLTKARIRELQAMTTFVQGDVCNCHWPD